jgi:hypothetical protein
MSRDDEIGENFPFFTSIKMEVIFPIIYTRKCFSDRNKKGDTLEAHFSRAWRKHCKVILDSGWYIRPAGTEDRAAYYADIPGGFTSHRVGAR